MSKIVYSIIIALLTVQIGAVYAQSNITEYHQVLKLPNEKMNESNYQTVKNAILSGPYELTLNITERAADQTEGFMIDQFVASIDNQTNQTGITK